MSKPFSDLKLQFAWLQAEVWSAKTTKQVKEATEKGRRLAKGADAKSKKAARSDLRKLNRLAVSRLKALTASSSSLP